MIGRWLERVIVARFAKMHAADRERLAEAILEAIPRDLVVASIKESVAFVLASRNIRDAGGDLAGELARNAAQSVISQLEGDA